MPLNAQSVYFFGCLLFALFQNVHALEIVVREKTQLSWTWEENGLRPHWTGRLTDSLGAGLGHQTLEVRILKKKTRKVVAHLYPETDDAGYFYLNHHLDEGAYRIEGFYLDPHKFYLPTQAHLDFKVQQRSLPLHLNFPTWIHASVHTWSFTVALDPPPHLKYMEDIRLWIRGLPSGEKSLWLSSPQWSYTWEGKDINLTLVFEGDDRFKPQTWAIHSHVFKQATLTLKAKLNPLGGTHALQWMGKLVQKNGQPMPDAHIHLEVFRNKTWIPIAHAKTQSNGHFQGFASESDLPSQWIEIRAVFKPDLGKNIQTPSLKLQPSGSKLLSWIFLGILSLFGILALFFALWRLTYWVQKFWIHSVKPQLIRFKTSKPPPLYHTVLGKRRRKPIFQIRGLLLDASTHAPISAQIHLIDAYQKSSSMTCSPQGRFESPVLKPGTYVLKISAPHYLSFEQHIAIPHKGRWKDFIIYLKPLRQEMIQVYEWLIHHWDKQRQWGKDTPLEIQKAFSELWIHGTHAKDFEELNQWIQAIYFGNQHIHQEDWEWFWNLTSSLAQAQKHSS